MSVSIEGLIEKIKREGVDSAGQEAAAIVARAREDAAAIRREAEAEAKTIRATAREEADRLAQRTRQALHQTIRDSELLLRERLESVFDGVMRRAVGETLDPRFLPELILTVARRWSAAPDGEIVLSGPEAEALREEVAARLRKELEHPIAIKLGDGAARGFRIGRRGEQLYYHFTDESIAELLRAALPEDAIAPVDGPAVVDADHG